jgi:hypothetical protein
MNYYLHYDGGIVDDIFCQDLHEVSLWRDSFNCLVI